MVAITHMADHTHCRRAAFENLVANLEWGVVAFLACYFEKVYCSFLFQFH
jgi:hypothetical protein